jgi:hypothetical protein
MEDHGHHLQKEGAVAINQNILRLMAKQVNVSNFEREVPSLTWK